jgi:hypothetical protein
VLKSNRIDYEVVREPIQYDPRSHDLFGFGFETSQPFYRQVAGYRIFDSSKRSEFAGYERDPHGSPFDLPWKSDLGTAASDDDPEHFYFGKIEKTGARPKRRIWSLRHAGHTVRPVFENGRCVRDYISIVHLPSYFSGEASRSMTLIGGIQKAGSAAIGTLVRDRVFLRELARQHFPAEGWQVIIETDVRNPDRPMFSRVGEPLRVRVDQDLLAEWRAKPPTF